MKPTPADREPLHLIEVGVSWPPETFLQWKLTSLAQRGFRVTVASGDVYDPSFSLPGVEMRRIPPWGEPILRIVLCAARECLKLAVSSPRRLLALLRAFRNPSLRSPVRAAMSYKRSPLAALLEDLVWFRILAPLAPMRPDVVHFEWESTAIRFLPLVAVWRAPMVMSCHGGLQVYACSPAHAMITAGLPNAFRQAAAVQCVSRLELSEALNQGLDPSKAVVIPCGVDPSRFSPPRRRTRGDMLRIISVGWLRWLKGYEYAIQTVRALLDSGVPAQLDVFGGDPLPAVGELSERARILHAIEDLDVRGHVVLHGYHQTDALVEHYRKADVLLHSSVSEGLPVVILEAMACGLPVVAADAGGVHEAVRDGVDGFVVPVREPGAAAAALERLWHNPELGEQMGRAGRERVVAEFALDRQLPRLERLYWSAVSRPRSAIEYS